MTLESMARASVSVMSSPSAGGALDSLHASDGDRTAVKRMLLGMASGNNGTAWLDALEWMERDEVSEAVSASSGYQHEIGQWQSSRPSDTLERGGERFAGGGSGTYGDGGSDINAAGRQSTHHQASGSFGDDRDPDALDSESESRADATLYDDSSINSARTSGPTGRDVSTDPAVRAAELMLFGPAATAVSSSSSSSTSGSPSQSRGAPRSSSHSSHGRRRMNRAGARIALDLDEEGRPKDF